MRFFIALELPQSTKNQLLNIQRFLKKTLPDVNLTDNDKLHLTIAFIGEHPQELMHPLTSLISHSAQNIPPFKVIPSYIDAFPNLHHPRIFWVGVSGEIDKLFILQERIKDGLEKLNLEIDNRRYIPHIAIGKATKVFISQEKEERLENYLQNNNFDEISIDSIKLFESIPSGDFHTHNTLAEVKLI